MLLTYFITGLELTEDQIKNLTLTLIEKHMERNRRSQKEFKGFPYPSNYVMEELGNRLIYDELNYDVDALKLEFERLFTSLTGNLQYHLFIPRFYIKSLA